jgi:hypothetical protein
MGMRPSDQEPFYRRLFGSNRRHAFAVVLLALVVATAGFAGFVSGQESSVDDSPPLDDIPADADGIVHVKSSVATNSATDTVMNEVLNATAAKTGDEDVPATWDDVLAELDAEGGIGVDDVHSSTTFVSTEGEVPYAGTILKTSLDWSDIEAAYDGETDLEEDSYNGVTVYVQTTDLTPPEDTAFGGFGEPPVDEVETWIADFGDGTFAVGSEDVVTDVIDTRQAEAPGIDDDLRSTFENTTDGHVTAALTVSDEQNERATEFITEEAGVPAMLLPEVDAVTMSYYTEDGQLNNEVNVVLGSADEAEMVAGFVEPATELPDAPDDPSPEDNPAAWVVDSVSVDTEENRVTLAFRAGPSDLLTAIDALLPPAMGEDGFGSHSSGDEAGL